MTDTSHYSPYEHTQLARHGVCNQNLLLDKSAPIEYITEKCEAGGLIFTVNKAVLIPRIETEELSRLCVDSFVKKRATTAKKQQKKSDSISILDVGTGSGFLGITTAISVSKQLPHAHIQLILSDISKEALDVAQINTHLVFDHIPNHMIEVTLVQSDLLSSIPVQTFDIILANLPYIPSSRIPHLDKSVIHHEPISALDGGPHGLTVIAQLLQQIPTYSNNKSSIWLEIDESHTVNNIKRYSDTNQFKTLKIHTDSFGKNRFLEVRLITDNSFSKELSSST